MSAPKRDRTHWHGCYTEHHECAVREVELLREATTRTEGILAAIPKDGQMTIHVRELNRLIGQAWLDGVVYARRALERVEEGEPMTEVSLLQSQGAKE